MARADGVSVSKTGQALALLPDGGVLLTGGYGADHDVTGDVYLLRKAGQPELLPSKLLVARAGHTATVLPNGLVLILGGVDSAGNIVNGTEIFDPTTQMFSRLPQAKLLPRAFHSATMLTDGTLLIAGGISAGGEMRDDIELWDYRTGEVSSEHALLAVPRQGHTATLLPNGQVLIAGGKDRNGNPATIHEVYNPDSRRFSQILVDSENPGDAFSESGIAASLPADGTGDVAIDSVIAVRFTKAANVRAISSQTITLEDSTGKVAASVVGVEGGRLAFVIPKEALQPGTDYTLTINELTDTAGAKISNTEIRFRTAGEPEDSPDDEWVPDAKALAGNWHSGRGGSQWQKLPPLQAPPGLTALAGQALRLSGYPLEHVTLAIDGQSTRSDRTGRFLLKNIGPGHHVLVIDGRTANRKSATYGLFEAGIDIAAGKTNVLNYTIWMTKLDMAHAVNIPSPTASADTVITSPRLPGLELHLPAKTVIVDHEGHPVHQLTITAIPLDKPPFPLPIGVRVPIYFTIQPGGSYIDVRTTGSGPKGARLFYPNTYRNSPGTSFDFWNYDPEGRGWYVYGQGAVDQSAQHIIPKPGVVVYELTGAMVGSPDVAPPTGPPAGNPAGKDGEPVDLSTGLFGYEKTDLFLPDLIPITLRRSYRTSDGRSRAFGIGTTHQYDMLMVGDAFPYTYQELILPDGSRIHYDRTSAGTGFEDAVYSHTATNTEYYGTTIRYNAPNDTWFLTMKDGTIYTFPDGLGATDPARQAVIAITDRYHNELSLTRDYNGNLTRITSASGRYIDLQYDASNRITSVTDNIGRTAQYTYDAGGRLSTVTDANAGVTTYTYDSQNQLLTIKDPRNIVYLTNEYDANGRVTKQTLADGSFYQFAWTPSANAGQSWSVNGGANNVLPTASAFRYCTDCSKGYSGLTSQVDITDPRGYVRRVTFNAAGYTLTDTRAWGQPEQQTVTYEYYADNLLKSITDPMGHKTSYEYDANGNCTRITRLDGTAQATTTAATYAAPYNELASVTDPLNNTTTFDYDISGNLITVTDALQHQSTMTYNSVGQLVTLSDPLQNVIRFGYVWNDLSGITDPLSNKTTRFVDAAGRVTSVTDADGHVTASQYDNLNQVQQITDPAGHIMSFTYDPNGNVLSLTDPNQHTTTYTYDNMDRLASRTDPLQRTETPVYDLLSNVISWTDRKGQVTAYSYDPLNRPTFAGFNKVTNGSTTTYESTVSYTYDADNRLTEATDSLSGTISYSYDGLDRLLTATTPQGSLSYGYDLAGRRTSRSLTGQPDVTYTWDNAGRLTQILQGATSVGIAYDNANRRSVLTLPNGVTATYTYDAGSRLTGLSYQLGTTTIGDLTYSYDALGRVIQMGGSLARSQWPAAVASATYDAANELTSWNGTALTYDANGNMTSDGSRTFIWNTRNQLVSMSGAAFQYDALGRRIGKTVGSQFISFLYDGANSIQENSGAANILTGGTDEFFLRTDSNGSGVPITDALGSVLALVDSAGAMQTQYAYDAFGGTSTSGIANGNSAQYTGRENDGTGFYYYRARYYNSALGRFISEDPIGFGGGDMNLYAYTGNDPINLIDPSGLTWQSNWNYFWDWALGRHPNVPDIRNYGPNNIETQEMQKSFGAQQMRDQFRKNNCQTTPNLDYGTVRAYWDTTLNPYTADWSSTAAEVGGFGGASVTNNGNGTATFYIPNVSGTHSFFLHLVPDRKSPIGPMSNIYQYFRWTESIGGRKDKQGCY